MKAIINAAIVTPTKVLKDHAVIFDRYIHDILPMKEYRSSYNEYLIHKDSEIDACGRSVMPGLVDLHIHGSAGEDVMDESDEALDTISSVIAKNGTTTFLATTMTMSKARIYAALDRIRQKMDSGILRGARLTGAHLEGPFINPEYKGAQDEKHIIPANFEFINDYIDIIKIITLAPEMENCLEFIKKVRGSTDIVISVGHTDASFKQVKEAVACGASHMTHLFNAMSPLHHREPGAAGAGLILDITTELIADDIHVSPALYHFIAENKKDKLVLVTDCIRAGCMKSGEYELGGQKIISDGKSARLENGTLAGSILTLNKAVDNIIKNSSLDIIAAVNMASLYPARVIGLDGSIGSIEKGKLADIIIVSEDMKVDMTFVEGRVVYGL